MKLLFTAVNFMATRVQGPMCLAMALRPAPITVADLAPIGMRLRMISPSYRRLFPARGELCPFAISHLLRS